MQHALDDLARHTPVAASLDYFLHDRCSRKLKCCEEVAYLQWLGHSRDSRNNLRCLGFRDHSGIEFGISFLVDRPGESHGATREDDCSNSCSSHEAGSFHRVTTLG